MTERRFYDTLNRIDVSDAPKNRKLIQVWVGGKVPIVELNIANDEAILLSRALAPYKEHTRAEKWGGRAMLALATVGFYALLDALFLR